MNSREVWHHPLDADIRPATKSTYENQESNCSRLSTPIRRAKDNKPSSLRTFFMERESRHFIKTGCTPKKSVQFTSKIRILSSEFN